MSTYKVLKEGTDIYMLDTSKGYPDSGKYFFWRKQPASDAGIEIKMTGKIVKSPQIVNGNGVMTSIYEFNFSNPNQSYWLLEKDLSSIIDYVPPVVTKSDVSVPKTENSCNRCANSFFGIDEQFAYPAVALLLGLGIMYFIKK